MEKFVNVKEIQTDEIEPTRLFVCAWRKANKRDLCEAHCRRLIKRGKKAQRQEREICPDLNYNHNLVQATQSRSTGEEKVNTTPPNKHTNLRGT